MTSKQIRRRRRSRATWQALIAEQMVSDLTQRAFCQEKQLSLTTFQKWKYRLDQGSRQENAAPWVEVLPPGVGEGPSWDIELDLGGGVCLRLRQR